MVSMTPGGAQRRTAAFVARLIAAPVAPVPGWPMNLAVPAASHLWPGVTPWTGVAAGAVEQAASRAGTRRVALRMHRFLRLCNRPAHLEFPVFDSEGEATLDQVDRVLTKLLVAPAREDIEV